MIMHSCYVVTLLLHYECINMLLIKIHYQITSYPERIHICAHYFLDKNIIKMTSFCSHFRQTHHITSPACDLTLAGCRVAAAR